MSGSVQSVQSNLLDNVVAALTANTPWTAYRSRMASFPPAQLPAFNVLPDEGEMQYLYAQSVNHLFRFKVRMMCATVDEVDKACDLLYVAGSQAILADPTLGGLAYITRWVGQKWEREGEGELDQCALVVTFASEISTLMTDPSVQVA
jgi:hypothetical protein